MLSLIAALVSSAATAPPATVVPASDEIVVTARHDKCFVEYGQHPVSDRELNALSATWAAGTPVRVIEPRGASLKCEFQIMQYLNRHGAHMAQFVARSEDIDGDDTPGPAPAPVVEAAAQPKAPLDAPVFRAPARLAPMGAPVHASAAGIVSLRCLMAEADKPYPLDLEINEAKGTVTPSRPDTGGGSEMRAVFMPDTVRFGPFTLSRTTLRIQRLNGGNAAQALKEPSLVEGQCSLAQVRRVF